MLSEYDKSIPLQSGNTVSLVITFETAEEVKKVSDLISDGAVILSPMSSAANSSCFASLIDKFGLVGS